MIEKIDMEHLNPHGEITRSEYKINEIIDAINILISDISLLGDAYNTHTHLDQQKPDTLRCTCGRVWRSE